jgi:predicted GIY-YIG superfamily endonuclease
MEYTIRTERLQEKPTVAVRYEYTISDGGKIVLPFCKEVLAGLKAKYNARVILWTDEMYGDVLEDVLRFLYDESIPIDAINHASQGNSVAYDLLICGKAGFNGDWKNLGIQLGVLGLWQSFIIKCKDGRLYVGYTKDLMGRLDFYRSGGGKFVSKHGYKSLLWKSDTMFKKNAVALTEFLRKRGRKKQLKLVKNVLNLVSTDVGDGKLSFALKQGEENESLERSRTG